MKLTAAIAASYFGAEVKRTIAINGHMDKEERDYTSEISTPKGLDGDGYFFGENYEDVPYDQCQLILTPISKISDEDAFRCASMCGLHTAGNRVIRITAAVFVENDTYQLQISHNGYVCLRKNGALYNMDIRKVYDYLRSKGYDCGHGSIPSLIAAGVAVEKK